MGCSDEAACYLVWNNKESPFDQVEEIKGVKEAVAARV
jgi:hypothetical protein